MDRCALTTCLVLLLSCGLALQMEMETTSIAPETTDPNLTSSSATVIADSSTSATSEEVISSSSTVGSSSSTIESAASSSNATAQAQVQQQSCVTGKGDEGKCMPRQRCDYGTQNIDFTLYVPRNYTKKCEIAEVCCPENYITKVQEHSAQKNDFSFDDDD